MTSKVRGLLAGEPARLDGIQGTRPIRLGSGCPPASHGPTIEATLGAAAP